MDTYPLRPDFYARTARCLAAGALACMAACTAGTPAAPEAPAPAVPSTAPVAPSSAPSEGLPSGAPASSSSLGFENCSSIRAVRIGAYYNPGHEGKITDHLRLMRVALTPGSNVDLNDDLVSYIFLYEYMEEDPQYAAAMAKAYTELHNQPSAPLSARDVLAWRVAAPATCAPQRLTDPASQRQLQETKTVVDGVGKGLVHHLQDQASRLGNLAAQSFESALQQFDDSLERQLPTP